MQRIGRVDSTVVAILTALMGGIPAAPQSKVESSATCVVRNTRRRSTMVMTSMSELLMYSIALK